jgi:hypothetical protein
LTPLDSALGFSDAAATLRIAESHEHCRVVLVASDGPEAERLVQPNRRSISLADAETERPHAARSGAGDERKQESAPDSPPAPLGHDCKR